VPPSQSDAFLLFWLLVWMIYTFGVPPFFFVLWAKEKFSAKASSIRAQSVHTFTFSSSIFQ
jgi:hypothetical protein